MRYRFFLAFVLPLALFGCGDDGARPEPTAAVSSESTTTVQTGQAPADPAPIEQEPGSTAPGTPGPRALPATIVDLEVSAFPRPAAEACADNPTVVDVPDGGSIATAIADAKPGTTIQVAAGTYVEQPDEWLALQIDVDDLCVRAVGGPAVIESNNQGLGISLTGSDVVLEGLVLRGFEVGIAIDGREGVTQENLTIERTRIEALSGEFREGVIVYAEPWGSAPVVDGLLLLDVVVDGADLGVSCNVGPCHHVWVEGSVINGRRSTSGSGADAFAIEEGRQIAVVDTVVRGASADGIDTKADDVVVFGARVYDLGRNGVKLWRGGDVINTIIDGSGADASLVGEEPGTYRYLHTLVTHHGEGDFGYVGTWGYDSRSSGITVEIVNSIFAHNSAGGFFIPEGATLSMRHTILWDDTEHKLLDVGDESTFEFSDLSAFESAGHGVGNLIADPQFVDLGGHDYATGSSSPARDAGEVIPGLEVDALGGARVQGQAPDIGPIES